jgi:heme-degrading monooxygenase HmoA
MYARLVRFSVGPGKRAVIDAMAAEVQPLIASQPGCKGVTVFGDDSGEYGLFVLWDSQESANAAAAVVRPKLDQHLSAHAKGPPDARLFEVIDS